MLTFSEDHGSEKLECFFNYKANGLGTLTYKSGDVLKIYYAEGKKHGKGVLTYVDGSEEQVEYENGEKIE